jgi:hypothetical protein
VRAVAFSMARAAATQAAPAGPWLLLAAVGLALANETTLPINLTTGNNCTIRSLSGPIPSSLSLPSFHGNFTNGLAPAWDLEYGQSASASLLEVLVVGGVAKLVVELSGTGCIGVNTFFEPLPSNVVDSPIAVAAAAAAGGEAFLQAHPTGVSEEMALLSFNSSGSRSGPEWAVSYSTCSPFLIGTGSGAPGATFDAAVNATTGAVLPGTPTTLSCGGPPPPAIGNALQPGIPTLIRGAGTGGTLASQGCTSGDYCYVTPLRAVSDNVTPGDFSMNVTNGTGSEFPAVGFAITNAAGEVVVYSAGPFEASWTPGAGDAATLLTTSMSISVDMGTADPSGGLWTVNLTGIGPFTDSAEGWSLP